MKALCLFILLFFSIITQAGFVQTATNRSLSLECIDTDNANQCRQYSVIDEEGNYLWQFGLSIVDNKHLNFKYKSCKQRMIKLCTTDLINGSTLATRNVYKLCTEHLNFSKKSSATASAIIGIPTDYIVPLGTLMVLYKAAMFYPDNKRVSKALDILFDVNSSEAFELRNEEDYEFIKKLLINQNEERTGFLTCALNYLKR